MNISRTLQNKTMGQTLIEFLSLFGTGLKYTSSEDINAVEIICTEEFSLPSTETFNADFLNSRDKLFLSFTMGDNDAINYFSGKSYADFYTECLDQLKFKSDETIKLVIRIDKNNINSTISIYNTGDFCAYICSLSILNIEDLFCQIIKAPIFFDILFDDLKLHTQSILFDKIENKDKLALTNMHGQRSERGEGVKSICHTNLRRSGNFLPNDFFIKESESVPIILRTLFDRIALLYAVSYIFDDVSVENNSIIFRLNGYKTIIGRITFDEIDTESLNEYISIYEWCYNEGNLIDKIGITRNILSLHLDRKDNLTLEGAPLFSILSNYEIYRKQNIKQYVEIRNKLSDHLLDLKDKADKIVDNFASDFKKSIFAFVSFFASIVVVQVLRNGDFVNVFSIDATLLSIAFLIIAYLFFIASRWELSQQYQRYEEMYRNLKLRQKDLLNDDDLKRILNNDADYNANIKYIQEKKKKYSHLWINTIIVFLLFVAILCFIRYHEVVIQHLAIILYYPFINLISAIKILLSII